MKFRLLKTLLISCILVLCAVLIGLNWVLPEVYVAKAKFSIGSAHLSHLDSLGREALKTNDVPVACILIFNDSIIGEGFNTVMGNHALGGHAEINALSDAAGKLGVKNLMKLNRDELILITTFEPCGMCMGAINEYRIKRVVFIKEKKFTHHALDLLRGWRYQWSKTQSLQKGLQDSLFVLHPDYPAQEK